MKIHLGTDDLCALAMLLLWPGVAITGITTIAKVDGRPAGHVEQALRIPDRHSRRGRCRARGQMRLPSAGWFTHNQGTVYSIFRYSISPNKRRAFHSTIQQHTVNYYNIPYRDARQRSLVNDVEEVCLSISENQNGLLVNFSYCVDFPSDCDRLVLVRFEIIHNLQSRFIGSR